MTKHSFLNELEKRLAKLPEADRNEIVRDYEEHFESAEAAGKSEAKVLESFGPVEKIAKEIAAEYHVEVARESGGVEGVISAVFAVGGLGFFNLIFVLTPAILVGAVIFALGVSAIAFVATPFLLLFSSAFGWQAFAWFTFFVSLALAGVGILLSIGVYYAVKWAAALTMRYLSFNLRVIKGGRSS